MEQFYTNKYIVETFPAHSRKSCMESHPDYNASPAGDYCWRCNALIFQREEWQGKVVGAVKELLLEEGKPDFNKYLFKLKKILELDPSLAENRGKIEEED